jgi:glycine cleavage system H protein
MVFILVLLTFAGFIAYDVIRNHRLAEVTAGEAASQPISQTRRTARAVAKPGLAVPNGIYYHQGHTWAKLLNEDTVAVGIDDFAQKFIGEIEQVHVPKSGARIKQGEPVITLKRGQRTLKLVAPVSGRVVQVNEHVEEDPDLINESPYEEGWVLKVKPVSLRENLRNLFSSDFASHWMKVLKHTFMNKYANEYALAMQDGGDLAPGFGMELNDEQWKEVTEEFFKNF